MTTPLDLNDDASMFELAPVSLWLEDYSELKALFDQWRCSGLVDLRQFLFENPDRVKACSARIRVLKVNRKTLEVHGADSLEHLVANLHTILRDDMLKTYVEELVQLWNGALRFFSLTVNYTLTGRRLDMQLNGMVLPGHEENWDRVLVATEDVTDREAARRRVAESETYARALFEHSPVSLWVEDFSAIKVLLDEVRFRGISDFRVFTDVHPEFVFRCMKEIRVIDVNRETLDMFHAPDRPTLMKRLGEVFRDDMQSHFREQLVDLWNGMLFQRREVVNYALNGETLHVLMQFSVLPGHERDWSLVQVALTDITARKKAEAYLEFLGKHDALTKLFNRSFFIDELNRLERKGPMPVSIIMIDLNGLKEVNDQLGHGAGDGLLRRAGEVLCKAADAPCHAARIGGDEFAVLMPATDEDGAAAMIANIHKLIELNNQFYGSAVLNLSMGAATGRPGESLETTAKRADLMMYEAKNQYYRDKVDRRQGR